jgi:hypothetical protein
MDNAKTATAPSNDCLPSDAGEMDISTPQKNNENSIIKVSTEILFLSCWARRYCLARSVETAWHRIGARGVHM